MPLGGGSANSFSRRREKKEPGASAKNVLPSNYSTLAHIEPCQKPPHQRSNLVDALVEREMPSIENVNLGLRHVAQIGRRLGGLERGIVLAPDDEQWRPCARRATLARRDRRRRWCGNRRTGRTGSGAGRAARDARPPRSRSRDRSARAAGSCRYARSRATSSEVKAAITFASCAARSRPERLARVPQRAEPVLVRHRVLHDHRRDAIGMLDREAEADRAAVIVSCRARSGAGRDPRSACRRCRRYGRTCRRTCRAPAPR